MVVIRDESHQMVPGYHGVKELLIQGQMRIETLWIAEGKRSVRVKELLGLAKDRDVPVHFKKPSELSRLLPDMVHQGVVAWVKGFAYSDLDPVIALSKKERDSGLLIAADHITDAGNLGALMRTAAFFGAHGLILPKDRSATVNATVLRRSSGAHVHLPLVRVVNLARTLDLLAKKGFWIIGTSGEGAVSIFEFEWNRDLVLVLGNEQRGLSRAVRGRCHQVVSIPRLGGVASLNVSVAGGVVLSEIVRQRKGLRGAGRA